MKYRLILLLCAILCTSQLVTAQQKGHYAAINGLQLYYEIHGSGSPLVLIHGGGSTIESSFGRVLPELAKTHQVIAVEMQAHGHTRDIDREMTFEQDADDIAALLQQLHIAKADILGFSNGGTTSLQVAIRHPEVVNKLILCSTLYSRAGTPPGFFDGFAHATLDVMPKELKTAYLKTNPDPKGLQAMFNRDVARMKAFKDIPEAAIKAIQAPALVINGAAELILPEHALALSRTLSHGQLAIFPGGHGEYMGEAGAPDKSSKEPEAFLIVVNEFLGK
ncbi:MAG: alpha/beta hydrolase [Chitinophaga sp.]|uniref:alpha/beta fold hydrolase n=1 Tax=Chitinophaga sp. TaxID=1869181 RepID=UPI001B218427|nr:alpha/beta hydrolase [Chitinophaga sp.]MBO9731406.1 alpha/beta hydrolase [Chitinophaga sp.]